MKSRNFCIIAHIDHGKSTLSDRIIELCSNLPLLSISDRTLDSMELEKERGITIKLASIRLRWRDYILNLIDTPGHIDFSSEVSKSLKAVEGAILLIDATKGIQSQTLLHFQRAKKEGIAIFPVLNKIDSHLLDSNRLSTLSSELEKSPFKLKVCNFVSAKTGEGVEKLLDYLVEHLPSPLMNKSLTGLKFEIITENRLFGIVFEIEEDNQQGTICTVRLFSGILRNSARIYLISLGLNIMVRKIEFLTPKPLLAEKIELGEVGRIYLNVPKNMKIYPGEYFCDDSECDYFRSLHLLSSKLEKNKPIVFSFITPYDESKRSLFIESLNSLHLSDSSFEYSFSQSSVLGFGANIGALGPLHLEILISRLEREFNLEIISSLSSVEYKAILQTGEEVLFSSIDQAPVFSRVKRFLEPILELEFTISAQFEGEFMSYISSKRAFEIISLERIEAALPSIRLKCSLPLSLLNSNFVNSINSITKGFIEYQYTLSGYSEISLVKVEIYLNGRNYPELSFISECSEALQKARGILLKLKDSLDPELYEIALQAKINGKVIARENLNAVYKKVASKCYGGDISRKKKLWKRQAIGKKKLRLESKIKLPQVFFKSLLSC